jgi:hypothetical protein
MKSNSRSVLESYGSLHLNDQNGLKFDQEKPFGSTNLRSAFNQVQALERHGYGSNGEFVCFDVHPFRTTEGPSHWVAHLANSRRTFLRLVEKARSFDNAAAAAIHFASATTRHSTRWSSSICLADSGIVRQYCLFPPHSPVRR